VVIGGHWDIAWHRAIGRDEFWTPPHIAIYACGVLAGLACAWLILHTSFAANAVRENTVRIFRFHAPLGAFIIAWGGALMLTSAPFDDWWHNAYGLDTKILSPPHIALVLGVLGVESGTLLLILGAMNRQRGSRLLQALFLYVGGAILVTLMVSVMELSSRSMQHSALFYRTMAIVAPPAIVAAGYASRHRWGMTIAAGVYTALLLGFLWILPFVSAEPKLGPVYYPVTHLIPPYFPPLIMIPAFVMDWYRHKVAMPSPLALGLIFFAVLLVVEWPFASFLNSEYARNWFFGSHYFGYYAHPDSSQRRNVFANIEKTQWEFWWTMAQAPLAAVLTSWLGLGWGRWMRSVQR
jgi:hypothetical protein